MKKTELLEILESLKFHPGKILGQNFLIDQNLLEYIVRASAPGEGEFILEAGPGFGALTRGLLAAGAEVTCIEFDHRISEYLRNNLKDPGFTLIEDDAARVDIEALVKGRDFRAIANLPYSISSIFVAHMLELENPPLSMCFMLQKEMGMRLAADNTTKNYGSLSVRTQMVYDVKILRTVPRQVFYPQPDVDSAIVQFIRRDTFPDQATRKGAFGMVKTAFSQKRKKMIKALIAAYSRESVETAYAALGYNEDTRPGQLTPDQFLELFLEMRRGE